MDFFPFHETKMEMLAKGFVGKRLRYQDLINQGFRMSDEKKKRGRPVKNEVKTIPAPIANAGLDCTP